MKLYSVPLSLLFFLIFFNYHCPASFTTAQGNPADTQKIKQVVIDAVEYNGWVNEPDYKEELGHIYTGPLLNDLLNSVEQFRSVSTDWHSLTFTPKCHIVYNDGNTALVLAIILDTNLEGSVTEQDFVAFKLHNTTGGWRITQMRII